MNVASRFRLDGRTALVSGAGRGIGRACALALAQAGAEVLLLSRTAKELEQAVSEIEMQGGRARAILCDVTDSRAVKKVFAGLASLDVLVNNAGTNVPEPFVEVSEEHLDRLLSLNVRAAFIVAQAAARTMLASTNGYGKAVINMSSQMGHVGAVNRSVYCLTKHALEGLTKAMALELAPHGIRVVSIAPTFVETPLTKPMFDKPEFAQWVRSRIPTGQIGQVEDVAAAVVFAASPAAALVTGSSLLVDGGWTAQ
ncbi:MAG TPA: SDR family oxidoreductase [Burkholderiales bacterium]|nr:SDR family oxidoreductase [Burkholderiales bacterium]